MKKTFIIVTIFATALLQFSFARDSRKAPASQLLTLYINLKDALVSNNSNAPTACVAEFLNEVIDTDKKTEKKEHFNALLSGIPAISLFNELNVRRAKTTTLSFNIFTFTKTVELSTELICQQYCPMKKGAGLRSNKAIKNPYYRSVMPIRDSINETL